MTPEKFFTPQERTEIEDAIRIAEKNTSGEIRVHLESNCKVDVLDRTAFLFEKLEMHKTKLRNGVLFYLSINDHKFAIIGDAGINSKVPENFWNNISQMMTECFKKGEFVKGFTEGILMCGHQLKEHFPYQHDDINEQPDEISFGK
jgi:uncharacterized membrane protein